MAFDDMPVVMYRIMSYLYHCMKAGQAPERTKYGPAALGIKTGYWEHIMDELDQLGYVRGVLVIRDMNQDILSVECNNPVLTLAGVEFLTENSLMAKAAKVIKDVGGIVF